MQAVGGFRDYQALRRDARAYDDVILIMEAQADAARQKAARARMKGQRGSFRAF